jgi:uncharacterized protein YndB with AHSA1/START domain
MSEQKRKHDLTITIDAPLEEVWRAITEGEKIQQWFAPQASVEPRLGGEVLLSWGPGMEGKAPITIWEPGKRFGWTEHGDTANPRVVEFTLEGEGGKTRLRLVHSGFGAGAEFDSEYDSTHGGWLTFLEALRYLTEWKGGATGRHEWRFAMLKGTQAEAWLRLTTKLGLEEQDWQPGAAYVARIPGGGAFSGTVWAAPKPGYALLVVKELDESLLGLFVEGGGGSCYFTTSWYLYGEGAKGGQPLLDDWAGFCDRFLAAEAAQ